MVLTELYWNYIKKAVLIRKFEEKLLELYSAGEFGGTVHTCIGQELSGVVTCNYLLAGDSVFSNHRGHGHYISKTGKVKELFAEILGTIDGACGGIGGSQHLFDKEFNFFSSGIQGGMLPIAAGVALANKQKNNDYISVVFIGDGTLGEGIVYETLNIVSKWSLPVVIILENNRIAQSTSIEQSFAGNVETRIRGFDIKYYSSDGQSLDSLDNTISSAIQFTRSEVLPTFIEIDSIVFLYGGNLGRPQGIDFLINVLNSNQMKKKVFFLIIGSGTEYLKISSWIEDIRPSNIKLIQALPKNEYDNLVRCADIGLVFLDKCFTIPNFPSRFLSYLENGMPVIAATDITTDLSTILEQNGLGFWLESGDIERFNKCIDRFASNPSMIHEMGGRGYNYLTNNYSVDYSYDIIMKHFHI